MDQLRGEMAEAVGLRVFPSPTGMGRTALSRGRDPQKGRALLPDRQIPNQWNGCR